MSQEQRVDKLERVANGDEVNVVVVDWTPGGTKREPVEDNVTVVTWDGVEPVDIDQSAYELHLAWLAVGRASDDT